jgi:hypothetical protein
MFYSLIQSGISFVESNLILVGLIMSIVAYIRLFLSAFAWCRGWMITVIAFLLAFLFAIPAGPFAFTAEFVLKGFILGLAATGIYKTGAALAEKAGASLK